MSAQYVVLTFGQVDSRYDLPFDIWNMEEIKYFYERF